MFFCLALEPPSDKDKPDTREQHYTCIILLLCYSYMRSITGTSMQSMCLSEALIILLKDLKK